MSDPVCAIYVRVSTGAQETEGTSLASQEAACRAYAVEHGYVVDERHVYREVHSGAELWERPKLTALREAVRGGAVQAIIALALDRLSREQGHLYIIDDEASRAGVELLFVTEEFEKTAIGKLIRSVKSFAAELEREKIRERSLRARRTIAESGKLHNSGIDLYGYRRDSATRTRAIHEEEAAIVRQIYRWIGEEGVSIRQVTVRLNDAGVPSPAVGKAPSDRYGRTPIWGSGTVNRILRNPAYKGEGYGWRYHDEPNRKVMRPRSEWLKLADGVSPAIVSPELWQLAQARLDANVGAETRNQKNEYLLRGIIRCAVCGMPMHSTPEGRGDKVYRIYRCSSRNLGHTRCTGRRVRAEEIEAWAWEQIDAAIRDPDLIARQSEQLREAEPAPSLTADLDGAKQAIAKIGTHQERLVRRLREAGDESFLWDLLEKELAALEREKAQHKATIAEIERRSSQHAATGTQLATLADYCARVASNLASFDFAEKRLAFEAFGVVVHASGRADSGQWWLDGSIPLDGGAGVTFQPQRNPAGPGRHRPGPAPATRRVPPSRN